MNDRQIARFARFSGNNGSAVVITLQSKRPSPPGGYPYQSGKGFIGTCSAQTIRELQQSYTVYGRR